MQPLAVAFIGGDSGTWTIDRMVTVSGDPLAPASHVEVVEGFASDGSPGHDHRWVLRGITSNERYVTRTEHNGLESRQEPLGRPASTRAALIPIKKSETWWNLAQDERRRIFDHTSHHVAIGLEG